MLDFASRGSVLEDGATGVIRWSNLASKQVSGTGDIVITLPVGFSSSRIALEIAIYDANSANGYSRLFLGGTLGTTWTNVSAQLIGTLPGLQVRFATNGSYPVIVIGFSTTSWNAVVCLDTLIVAASSVQSAWDSNWSIALTSSESGFTSQQTVSLASSTGGTSLPSQTGNAGKVLTTNGTSTSWSSTVNPLTISRSTSGAFISSTRSDITNTISLSHTAANVLTSSAAIVLPADPTEAMQAVTKQYIDNKVKQPYVTTIGDGSTTNFTITHGLGTYNIDVVIWETSGSKRKVDSAIEIQQGDDINTVRLVFFSAPAVGALKVIVSCM